MFRLGSVLDKLRKLYLPSEFIEKESKKIIDQYCPQGDDSYKLAFRKPILFLSTENSSLRGNIMIKKSQILLHLNKELKHNSPSDIRFTSFIES